MFCEKCGGELRQEENKLVCQKCGTQYGLDYTCEDNTAIISVAIKPRGSSSKRNIIIIVIAALLIFGGIGAAVAFGVSHSAAQSALSGFQLAEKYLSEQNYKQAIIAFEQLLEIEPMNVDAYLGLADAYLSMGDTDKALEVLRNGLEKTGDARIQAKIDELTKPTDSSNSSSSTVSAPEESEPEYGSMGSVTILGQKFDIATTKELLIYNKELYEAGDWSLVNFEERYENVIQINENLSVEDLNKIAQLTQLRRLEIDYVGISDVSPLENLPNLYCLYLWNNNIDNEMLNQLVPQLAKFPYLTTLDLTHNQISDVTPLAELTDHLYSLTLSLNPINDITPLAGLTNLNYLGLGGNSISDITPLAGLTNLIILSLSGNQISDISPLAGLTNLNDLYLDSNSISDITPLAGLTNLDCLQLQDNQISNITPLAGLTNLTELLLWDNQISEADKDRLKAHLPNCKIN